LRLVVFTVFFAVLVIAGANGASAMPYDLPGESAILQAPGPIEDLIPCDPVYTRSIEPRIFKIGEETTVRAEYNFKCTGEARKLNYFLVIENSGALRQGRGGREALDHVIEGAQDFVNQVDYANGSQGGLVLYAATSTVRLPLQGGNSAGAGAAIRDATGLLPTSVESEFANVLIIVDAGASETTDPLVTRHTACNAARQAGVTVAVVSFPNAQGRLVQCSSGGWFKQVTTHEGDNVEDIFAEFAEGMLRGKMMTEVTYSESLVDGFEFVDGSGYPREPDYPPVYGAFGWTFGRDAPQSVQFNVRASEDLAGTGHPRPLVDFAELLFEFTDKTRARAYLPNPDVCVYRDDPGECAGLPTLTPSSGSTDTPVATTPPPSDTPVPTTPPPSTTEVPVDTPTPTATSTNTLEPIGNKIYLPVVINAVPVS
jgi:hypothetical protein